MGSYINHIVLVCEFPRIMNQQRKRFSEIEMTKMYFNRSKNLYR